MEMVAGAGAARTGNHLHLFLSGGWQVPSRFRENWKALVVLTAVIAIFTNMVYSKDEPYFSQERDTHE